MKTGEFEPHRFSKFTLIKVLTIKRIKFMKKNWNELCIGHSLKSELLLKMKLLAFILFVSITSVTANSYSQQTRFTMSFEDVTVKQVFQEIEKNSEFIFIYSEKAVDINRKVKISADNKNVDYILDQLFNGTNNYYEINDRQIAVMLKKDTDVPAGTIKNNKLLEQPQKKTIKGKVTDGNGESLPGANIIEKGTSNGTTTNIDGEFTILVSDSNDALSVSFIGYNNQDVALNGQTSVVIVLEKKENQLNEIITTGTNRTAMTVLETSYATSIMTPKDMVRESAGMGVIDMLKGVPGLYGQSSGGEVGSSLSPRGLSSNFFTYISLQEDGLPVQYGGTYNEMQVRNDLTFGRVEVIRGGPSGVFAPNGAGAIVNFISYMPEGDPIGKVRLSVTDYGTTKGEFVYGGKMAEKWYATIGGYYREGRGIKPRGYTNQLGGQIRAKVKREIEGGAITLSLKLIDDATPLYMTLPNQLSSDGKLSPIPGYNSQTQALAGPQTRFAFFRDQFGWSRDPGNGIPFDLAEGIHTKSKQLTFKFEKEFNEHISISNHTRVSLLKHNQTDFRNGGGNESIQKVSDYIAANEAGYLSAIGNGATAIQLKRHIDGGILSNSSNGNGLVAPYKMLTDGNTRNVIINDFKFNIEAGGHHITIGNMYFNTLMKSYGAEQMMLIDLKEHANVIDIVGIDGTGAEVGQFTDGGVFPNSIYTIVGGNETQSISFIANDEYQVNDKLKIDAGVRYETINYSLDGVAFNGSNYYQQRTFHDVAWTLGGNYKLNEKNALYSRYASGFDFGTRTWDLWGSNVADIDLTRLVFSEVGFRHNGEIFAGALTAFRSVNKNVNKTTGDQGQSISYDNVAMGLEFQGTVYVSTNFNVGLSGVVMNSELTGGAGKDLGDANSILGKRPSRTPNVQLRVTPTLYFANRKGQIDANIHYIGNSYGDLMNTLEFPGYLLIGTGVHYEVYKNITLGLQTTNLTNAYGFTEGNPRGNVVSASDSPYAYARPILPRSLLFTLTFDF